MLPQLPAFEPQQIAAVEADVAAFRPFQQVDAPHQGAFPCARETDNAEDLPMPDFQRHILQRRDLIAAGAEGFG